MNLLVLYRHSHVADKIKETRTIGFQEGNFNVSLGKIRDLEKFKKKCSSLEKAIEAKHLFEMVFLISLSNWIEMPLLR